MNASVRSTNDIIELPQALRQAPAPARAFVNDLLMQRAEAKASGQVFGDQLAQLQMKRMAAAQRRYQLMTRSMDRLQASDPQIKKLDAEIEDSVSAIVQLRPRADRSAAIFSNNDLLIRNLENWMGSVGQELRVIEPIELSKPRKGEPVEAAIENCRFRQRELAANVARYRAAPLHSSVVLKAEIDRINDLAELGKPDAYGSIETGAPMKWPAFQIKEFIPGRTRLEFSVPDMLPIMCHLFRDQMIAAAKAAIADAADDAAALSIDERTRLIDEANRDALAVAREEVALIKAANAAGKTILFRPDTDPRALLDLADDLPAPQ